MNLRLRILGCGSSMGVPRLGGDDGAGDWGSCDPNEPKNRRTRCSVLVQASEDPTYPAGETTTLLVDTSPDLRQQLLDARVGQVDHVLITHDHADQTHGIDDLRVLSYKAGGRIPVHIDPETAPALQPRFGYCFNSSKATGYPAILEAVPMAPPGERFSLSGGGPDIPVTCFIQSHGAVNSLGFVFGQTKERIAYSSDVNALDEAAFRLVNGCEIWVLDALRYVEHPSHSNVAQSLSWIEKAGVRRGVLTNLHIDLDYQTLLAETPPNVEPAYDGMILTPGQG